MLVCVIERRKWARGPNTKGYANGLMTSGGSLCCLGFLGQACGVPDESLRKSGIPTGLTDEEEAKYPQVDDWQKFVRLNDDRMDESVREAGLEALAKEYGFEFQFVGE